MKLNSPGPRFLSLAILLFAVVALFAFAGCDLGTYGERVETSGQGAVIESSVDTSAADEDSDDSENDE